ncbi:MAG: hypothetical protein HS114_19465 [Anaerolineales bacterium]|nr:hypothetical protein [Anaerolineales bacterium]
MKQFRLKEYFHILQKQFSGTQFFGLQLKMKSVSICGEHQIQKEWRPTTFEYSDEGISIRVPNIVSVENQPKGKAA